MLTLYVYTVFWDFYIKQLTITIRNKSVSVLNQFKLMFGFLFESGVVGNQNTDNLGVGGKPNLRVVGEPGYRQFGTSVAPGV